MDAEPFRGSGSPHWPHRQFVAITSSAPYHLGRLIRGQGVEYLFKVEPCLHIRIATKPDRVLPDVFHQIEHVVAMLLPDCLAQQGSQLTDILAQGFIFVFVHKVHSFRVKSMDGTVLLQADRQRQDGRIGSAAAIAPPNT